MFDARMLFFDLASRIWKKVSTANPLPVGIFDGTNLDAFSRISASLPHGIYQMKFLSSRHKTQWEERLTGAIIVHGTVTGPGFQVGETITGGDTGKTGVITASTGTSITYTTSDNDFDDAETITGGTTGSTATITSHNTGADITYNYNGASVLLSLGTVTGQKVIRQTTRYFPYVPSYGHHINLTNTLAAGKAGLKQTVMYGDDLNGIGFVLDGTTMYLLLRSNTSGSASDVEYVAQSSWNIDTLGAGKLNPSGITLDVTKSQIEDIDFQWLGVGRVRMALNIGGMKVPIHEFNQANESAGVYMRTPTLPIRYEIENTGTTASSSTLEQICCAVSSDGGYALPGNEFSAGHTWAQEIAVGTTRRPLFAIRLKAEYPAGKPNRSQVRILDYGGFARTDDILLELIHVHNPLTLEVGGAPQALSVAWTSIDENSAVEYLPNITALTADHMHFVQPLIIPAGSGNNGNAFEVSADSINAHAFISQNFESNNSEMFVVYGTARSLTSNCVVHITEIESE